MLKAECPCIPTPGVGVQYWAVMASADRGKTPQLLTGDWGDPRCDPAQKTLQGEQD